jgi:putative endonuclease
LISKSTRRKQKAHRHGLWAEFAALLYLTLKGYWLVSWRTKTPVGEIDLVMRRGKTLIFVEVKARAARDDAAHAIHAENQSRVVRAAQYFLRGHPNYTACYIRFDAVLIAWYRWPHHIQNAFS